MLESALSSAQCHTTSTIRWGQRTLQFLRDPVTPEEEIDAVVEQVPDE
jgi:hypothetical protein